MEIEREIVQAKFQSPMHKAVVNVLYTAGRMAYLQSSKLKPHGLSIQQYNVLRILRGQHPKPASISLLTDRMLDKTSNASRLVDKLQLKGFVERSVSPEDRRQAHVQITHKGLEFLARMDILVDQTYDCLGKLSNEELDQLSQLLDKLRTR